MYAESKIFDKSMIKKATGHRNVLVINICVPGLVLFYYQISLCNLANETEWIGIYFKNM